MSSTTRIGLVLGVAFFLAASGWAQVVPPATPGTLEGVINEIRLCGR